MDKNVSNFQHVIIISMVNVSDRISGIEMLVLSD